MCSKTTQLNEKIIHVQISKNNILLFSIQPIIYKSVLTKWQLPGVAELNFDNVLFKTRRA